jgi:cellulose synthase/poly-beta-1,6-N-acetylglucosamine synthase-like glycosyltransferase
MTTSAQNSQSISIIIPTKKLDRNIKECIEFCLGLDYQNFEIIILPDEHDKDFLIISDKIKILPTGNITPPKKRDFALDKTNAEILAFIDADAYPNKDWLRNAVRHFLNDEIVAVCGPAITAPDDSFRQKASGEIYESILLSGNHTLRYKQVSQRYVNDCPSCNFIIRRSTISSLGGFNTNFWPGEDTFLCAGIVKKLNKKILYDPEVLVYHHRRPLFFPHLKQIANYALHRGYFTKKGFNPRFNLGYFLPSLLILGLASGMIVSLFNPVVRYVFFACLFTYLILVLIFSISKDLRLILLKFFGIIFSHITYGFFFLKGLFQSKLKEE